MGLITIGKNWWKKNCSPGSDLNWDGANIKTETKPVVFFVIISRIKCYTSIGWSFKCDAFKMAQ